MSNQNHQDQIAGEEERGSERERNRANRNARMGGETRMQGHRSSTENVTWRVLERKPRDIGSEMVAELESEGFMLHTSHVSFGLW